jgi:integrase
MNDKQVQSLIRKGKEGRFSAGGGLYLRVTDGGTGLWAVRYSIHTSRREITIGRYPELTLADATLKAAQIKVDVKNKIDPLAEKHRGDNIPFKTVDDLAEDWLKDCEKRLKYPQIPRRIYTKDLKPMLGALGIDQVNPRDIRAVITSISDSGRPSISNDALMYCKQLFRHAVKLDLRTTNPADAFTVNDAGGVEQSRSRALSIDELKTVFQCFRKYKDQFTRENYLACALLLALGVRKGELIAAEWKEFDFEKTLWHIPQERSKTGVAISVPLSKEVMTWLEELKIRAYGSDFVFPNRRASKRFGHISPDTLNAAIQKLFKAKKLPVDHFTVHDFRRTCRSLLASAGVPGHVAERCLNHKLKGVEGIYDRYDYLDERREALQKLSAELSRFVNV